MKKKVSPEECPATEPPGSNILIPGSTKIKHGG